MAGQHRAIAARGGDGRRLMRRAHPVAKLLLRRDMAHELVRRIAVLAHDIVLELGHVAELPLAGRVVHQADDADAVVGAELVQFLDQRFRTHLGPQVQTDG